MDKKEIQSNIRYKIISEIYRTPNIQFKEIKDRLNISSPTLTIHLKSLLEKNQIIFEKKGREKYYRLNKKYVKTPNVGIEIFRSNHINQVERLVKYGVYNRKELEDEDEEITDQDGNIPVRDYYENLVNMVGTYFLFTLFKSLETGDNWFKGFDKEWIAIHILDKICDNEIKDFDLSDLPFYLGMEKDFDKFFKKFNIELGINAKNKTKIFFKNLEEINYYHFNALKESLREDFKQELNL